MIQNSDETPNKTMILNETGIVEPSAQTVKQGSQQPAAVLFAAAPTEINVVESNLDGNRSNGNQE